MSFLTAPPAPATLKLQAIRALYCLSRTVHDQRTDGVACALRGGHLKRFGQLAPAATAGQEGVCDFRVAPIRA